MHFNKLVPCGIALSGLAGSAVAQGYQCPLMQPAEVTALKFAHALQSWLSAYYESNGGTDASPQAFSTFPNASTVQSNNEPLAANLATNMAGLAQQADLAVRALEDLGMGADLDSDCDFTYPPGLDNGAQAFYMSASFLEASLCGAFIGLGAYVQNPAAAFLMARIAAEHGIHGSFLRSLVAPVPFSPNSSALTPAFTPEQLLEVGDGTASRGNVGNLGKWLGSGCLVLPEAPCGSEVSVGDLTAEISGGGGGAVGGNATAGWYGAGNATGGQSGGKGGGNATAGITAPYTGGAAAVGFSGLLVAGLLGVAVAVLV